MKQNEKSQIEVAEDSPLTNTILSMISKTLKRKKQMAAKETNGITISQKHKLGFPLKRFTCINCTTSGPVHFRSILQILYFVAAYEASTYGYLLMYYSILINSLSLA